MNVGVSSITAMACPNMVKNVIQPILTSMVSGLKTAFIPKFYEFFPFSMQGLPSSVMIGTFNANGCAVVTPLPSAASLQRVAYKFYFALTAPQWATLSSRLVAANTVTLGHVMCSSTLHFQAYPLATNTRAPIDATTNPAVSNWCLS